MTGRPTPPPGLRTVVVVGPTASGKTALAIDLAHVLGDAEIVSVDSMQVYRRMDIGTGKASPAERAQVPHHLLDIVEPSDEFSVSWFQTEARTILADLAERKKRAILVGGTGLYHRAVVDDLVIPPEHPELRAELEAEVEGADDPTAATVALHTRLATLDPVAAGRIEPTNTRRVIRALEVVLGSGTLFSEAGPGLEAYPDSDHLMVGLNVERDRIGPLVADRVARMMADGFLDEVSALRDEPAGVSRTARQALGYRELLAHLDGTTPLDAAVDETVVRTRQFAVRQDRWFRRDPRIGWFPSPAAGGPETRSLATRIAGRLEGT